MTLAEIKRAIYLLIAYADCVAWMDFSDKGNGSGQLDILPNKSAIINNAISYFNVQLSMPKYSDQHTQLAVGVKKSLGMHRVPSYDWLIKVVSRILQVADYNSFKQMLMLAVAVRAKMKEQNLTQIDSLEEVFGC